MAESEELRRTCYHTLLLISSQSTKHAKEGSSALLLSVAMEALKREKAAGNGRYLLNMLTCLAIQVGIPSAQQQEMVELIVGGVCEGGWPLDVQLVALSILPTIISTESPNSHPYYGQFLSSPQLTKLVDLGNEVLEEAFLSKTPSSFPMMPQNVVNVTQAARLICALGDALFEVLGKISTAAKNPTLPAFVAFLCKVCRVLALPKTETNDENNIGASGRIAASALMSGNTISAQNSDRSSSTSTVISQRVVKFFSRASSARKTSENIINNGGDQDGDNDNTNTAIMTCCLEERLRAWALGLLHQLSCTHQSRHANDECNPEAAWILQGILVSLNHESIVARERSLDSFMLWCWGPAGSTGLLVEASVSNGGIVGSKNSLQWAVQQKNANNSTKAHSISSMPSNDPMSGLSCQLPLGFRSHSIILSSSRIKSSTDKNETEMTKQESQSSHEPILPKPEGKKHPLPMLATRQFLAALGIPALPVPPANAIKLMQQKACNPQIDSDVVKTRLATVTGEGFTQFAQYLDSVQNSPTTDSVLYCYNTQDDAKDNFDRDVDVAFLGTVVWMGIQPSVSEKQLLELPVIIPGSLVYFVVSRVVESDKDNGPDRGRFLFQCRIIINTSPLLSDGGSTSQPPPLLLFGPLLDGVIVGEDAFALLLSDTIVSLHRYCRKDLLGQWWSAGGATERADSLAQLTLKALNNLRNTHGAIPANSLLSSSLSNNNIPASDHYYYAPLQSSVDWMRYLAVVAESDEIQN